MRISTAVSVTGLVFTATAAAAEPVQPLGPWQLDYGISECTLAREFGATDDKITFGIVRGPSLNALEFVLKGKPLPKINRSTSYILTLSDASQGVKVTAQPAKAADEFSAMRLFGATADFLNGATDNSVLELRDRSTTVAMKVSGLKRAATGLEQCHDQLFKAWGIDTVRLRALKTMVQPLGRPSEWITTDDYPSESLARKERGEVSILVQVSKDGHPTECRVVRSVSPALDQRSCALIMRRGRFEPARDAAGNAAEGLFSGSFRWWAD